ncbi:MAG: hypothetical protein NUV75_12970 [Gallionella sp.]|nr:hypothetical protein [Gallionella sp.]
MTALYHGRDVKNLPAPRDDELLMTALASFVVGAGFAMFVLLMMGLQ